MPPCSRTLSIQFCVGPLSSSALRCFQECKGVVNESLKNFLLRRCQVRKFFVNSRRAIM